MSSSPLRHCRHRYGTQCGTKAPSAHIFTPVVFKEFVRHTDQRVKEGAELHSVPCNACREVLKRRARFAAR